MEKRRAHYDLKAIQTQMNCIEAMNLTVSARHGIKTAGMSIVDVLKVVQGLGRSNFYKSMTPMLTIAFGKMFTMPNGKTSFCMLNFS